MKSTRNHVHSSGGVPEQPEDDDGELDLKAMIDRILVNLDQWSMRVSLVEIQLLIKQATITDGRPVARLSVSAKNNYCACLSLSVAG